MSRRSYFRSSRSLVPGRLALDRNGAVPKALPQAPRRRVPGQVHHELCAGGALGLGPPGEDPPVDQILYVPALVFRSWLVDDQGDVEQVRPSRGGGRGIVLGF